jgi:hypothetical protein
VEGDRRTAFDRLQGGFDDRRTLVPHDQSRTDNAFTRAS